MSRAIVTLALVAGVAGCVIDDVSLEGKQCPCDTADGWSCDVASNLCVRTPEMNGKFDVSDLRVSWATPTQLSWTWTAGTNMADFSELRFVLGNSMADVAQRTNVTILDRTTNPELGELYLRHSGQLDPANTLITRDLLPDTDYYGQLIAVDTEGGTQATNLAHQHTAVVTTDVVTLYSDQNAGPCGVWFDPPELGKSTTGPLQPGGTALSYSAPCGGSGQRICYQNLQVGCPNVAITPPFNVNRFTTTAYLELHLAMDVQPTSDWMSVIFVLSDNSAVSFAPFTVVANGNYATVQVPLAVMTWTDPTRTMMRLLQYDDLVDPTTQQLRSITSFLVGGEWASGSTVRIDEVAIHY